jgi:hypothetical protein
MNWKCLKNELTVFQHGTELQGAGITVFIATGYELDDQGVRVQVPVGSRIFSSTCSPDWLWGPPNLLSNGYWGALPPPVVKRLGCEADHSP